MREGASRNPATAVGFSAVLLWSLLALLTAASGSVPPFQLTAMAFAIGGSIGMLSWTVRPAGFSALRAPLKVWVLGVGGLFGYHFLYFTALRNAPPVEAGLIAYLWPLLIVLLAAGAHIALEETVWPATQLEWLAVLGLGMGPVGLAFYVWDYGVKNGDIQVLGASSYLAPLLSTLLLLIAGFGEPSWLLAVACLLITGGALLAARDLFRRRN